MISHVDNADNVKEFFQCFKEDNSNKCLHHHFYISHNLQNSDEINAVHTSYSQISINASLPLPLSKKCLVTSYDSSLKYTTDKKRWKDKIKIMKREYQKLPNKRKITQFKSILSECTIPLYLFKFTKLLKQDPDPYFDSDYNWYLSGNGNLCSIILENNTYMLKAANELLYIHKLNNDLNEVEKSSFICDNKKLIHETVYSNNLIGLRQKNSIKILRCSIINDGDVKLSPIITLKSDIPIVSFNLETSGNICYSCADGTIYVHDTKQNEHIIMSRQTNKIELNNWSRIEPVDENIYLEVTYKHLNFIDKRVQIKTDSYTPTNFKSCEKITTFKLSKRDSNYVFLGSTHSFQIYDIRFLKNNENNFVKIYSHGLKLPPLFISECSHLDKELIFLHNQSSDESCIITNSEENVLPWHPPSIHHSFKEAQQNGYCLDPTTNFKGRIASSITGHVIINNEDQLHSVQLNSCGDTFYQNISDNYCNYDQGKFHNSLEMWCESIPNKNTFYTTEQINLSQVNKMMSLRRQPKKLRQSLKYVPLIQNNKIWKNKLTYMSNCTDMFAHELLSFWEVDSENIANEITKQSSPDNYSNVTSWLSQFK